MSVITGESFDSQIPEHLNQVETPSLRPAAGVSELYNTDLNGPTGGRNRCTWKTDVNVLSFFFFSFFSWQMVAKLQKKFLGESYPSANHVGIGGVDRRMIYQRPSVISQHLRSVVRQRQSRQQSE